MECCEEADQGQLKQWQSQQHVAVVGFYVDFSCIGKFLSLMLFLVEEICH